MDVNRSRSAGGENRKAIKAKAGTRNTRVFRQNQTRYKPATASAIQTARVSPRRMAPEIRPAQSSQAQNCLRVPAAKSRKDASMMRANISSAEYVFQWLVNPVIRSAT